LNTPGQTLFAVFADCFDNPCRQVTFLARLRQMLLGATDQVAHAGWMVEAERSQFSARGVLGPQAATQWFSEQLSVSRVAILADFVQNPYQLMEVDP
jgi:hypothetical protein